MSLQDADVEAAAPAQPSPRPSTSSSQSSHNAASVPNQQKSDPDNDEILSAAAIGHGHAADEANDQPPSIRRVVTELGPPIKVPRSEQRGLFGRFSLIPEVIDPKTYPRRTKWSITGVVSAAAVVAPLGSSIFFPSLQQVTVDLHTTPTIANLSIALYMLSLSIFPLWWSTLSEVYGRRSIYIVSFALYLVFNVVSAVSNSIAMLTIFRLLGGGASGSVQAVGAGTLADIWEPRERGRAMGIFYLGPLMGPLLGPIIGGVLANKWAWRSTLWFMVIYGALTFIIIFMALPETLATRKQLAPEVAGEPAIERWTSRVSSQRAIHQTAHSLKVLKRMLVDPLRIILYLRFPAILLTVYYSGVSFCSLYMLNTSIQESFSAAPYDFSTLIVGLLYIPSSVGYVLGSLVGGRWMDMIMAREARKANRYDEKGKLVYHPEDRMRENTWLGALLYPAALIWYGWTVEKKLYWIVPMIANFIFGFGSILIFATVTTMLTEFMPKKASTGVALNNFVRNILSCVGVVVTSPILQAIGNGWLFTILGLLCFLSSLSMLALKIYGPRWRKTMEFHLN